jgi:hypothetical protein
MKIYMIGWRLDGRVMTCTVCNSALCPVAVEMYTRCKHQGRSRAGEECELEDDERAHVYVLLVARIYTCPLNTIFCLGQ